MEFSEGWLIGYKPSKRCAVVEHDENAQKQVKENAPLFASAKSLTQGNQTEFPDCHLEIVEIGWRSTHQKSPLKSLRNVHFHTPPDYFETEAQHYYTSVAWLNYKSLTLPPSLLTSSAEEKQIAKSLVHY